MSKLVVDRNVAIKWLIPEIHTELTLPKILFAEYNLEKDP